MNCTVAIAADDEEELLDAAIQHAVSVHQEKDTPELRREIKKLFKESPRAAV
jgi:predicted small metal-binding protein